ncbi:hypothetical protein AB0J90_34495 [Micromonospora sp. NPDC049523]|uniref:hypothetical protein n=1 Tax=Micromonospora sp. NPDC049523 TaxID=3155921 RepID=UPI0034127D69
MVVRQASRRGTPSRRGLFISILAGAALAAALTVDGPAAARQVVALSAVVPMVAPGPGGTDVTFEVLPPEPTVSPTTPPTPPTPRPTHTGGHLPVTGDDPMPPGWLFAVGGVLLLLGALTLAVSRGLRHRRS